MTRGRDVDDFVDVAIAYHERTKHHYHRYANSLGYLDWANQPDPFRRYAGTRTYLLPFGREDTTPRYGDLFACAVAPRPLDAGSLSQFLELSLGISATKQHAGSRWKLRCNPSSGNLHPTECYIAAGAVDGLGDAAALYHYAPEDHALEVRAALPETMWRSLVNGWPPATILCGLTSIHWREAWKYGERAFRYCQHDLGHALGAIRFSAAALGWRCTLLDGLSDETVAALLGLDARHEPPAEREYPCAVVAVTAGPGDGPLPNILPREAIAAMRGIEWIGMPNRLSAEHVEWEIIREMAENCRKPETAPQEHDAIRVEIGSDSVRYPTSVSAGQVFRQRRSAVAMDGSTSVSRDTFFGMLQSTLPVKGRPPFDLWPYDPAIHFGLFVHRVDGVDPGVYALVRDPARLEALRASMRADFRWERPEGAPDALPLFLLAPLDCRALAAQVSCLQEIAGDGAFSLGMIAEFEGPLRRHGAWFYPRLFWEAGLVGQLLYLEAEAAGVRSTGIGCYFDDAAHGVFGLRGHTFQSLYHFTVGGPVDDPRITGEPAYEAGRREQSGWV